MRTASPAQAARILAQSQQDRALMSQPIGTRFDLATCGRVDYIVDRPMFLPAEIWIVPSPGVDTAAALRLYARTLNRHGFNVTFADDGVSVENVAPLRGVTVDLQAQHERPGQLVALLVLAGGLIASLAGLGR